MRFSPVKKGASGCNGPWRGTGRLAIEKGLEIRRTENLLTAEPGF